MGRSLTIILAGYLIIFSIISGGIRKTGRTAEVRHYSDFERSTVRNIANSGINAVLYKISQNRDWTDGFSSILFGGGTLSVTVTPRLDINENAIQITSTAAFNSIVDSVYTIIDAQEISSRFSRYAYFSDYEPTIWFYSADTLFGPVHTNGHFHMTGTPVFNGLVSSVSPTYETMGTTNPEFNGGTDFGRSAITLPTNLDDLKDAALNGGHMELSNPLYLEFLSNGTYNYKSGYYGTWQNRSLSAINGVIGSFQDIYVHGVVNGQVTVVTTQNIYITDDLVYNTDPKSNPDSEDLIGLVSENNIYVQDNAQNRIKCEIQASMMAVDGSFKAENIYFTPQGKLEVYGSMVQDTRGAVGKLYPTSGYEKYYQYDKRLEHKYPPYFPVAPGALTNVLRKTNITFLYWVE